MSSSPPSESTGRSITQNASSLMVSQLVTWGLSLLLLVFLPRYLGPAAMGQIHLANSIWGIMAIVVTFGMDLLLTREIASQPEKTSALFGTSLVLRLLLYGVSFAAVAVYVRAAGYSAETITIIYIIGSANFLWNFINTCRATLQGLERMEYISLSNIAGTFFNTAVVLLLLWLGFDVVAIAAVAIGAAAVTLAIQYQSLRRVMTLQPRFDRELAVWLLRTSVPFFLSTIFLTMYQQIDTVIISLLVDEKTLGWYGTADKLFGTLLFIPTVFMTAIFPVLSRMYANADEALPQLISRSFNLLLLLSVPIGLGILAIADPLVLLLFGSEFAGSGPVLAIMGIVLLLTYQNMLMWQFYISSDKQRRWTVVMALALLATLPLDLVLIPWCRDAFGNGAIGGALAFVVTETGMLIVGLRWLPHNALTRQNAVYALRVLAAGIGMVLAVWWVREQFIAVPIVVGASTYVGLIVLLRTVPADDWQTLRLLADGLWRRVSRRPAPVVDAGA